MAMLALYQSLIEAGALDVADCLLCENVASIGYAKAVWRVWRFHAFEGLEPLRAALLNDFAAGAALPVAALEALYYLQEQRAAGDAAADRALQLPAIFSALCRQAAHEGRARAIGLDLIRAGVVNDDADAALPGAGDPDVAARLGARDDLDLLLLDLARANRRREAPISIIRNVDGDLTWTDQIDPERTLALYIGPYYFQLPPLGAQSHAKIDSAFQSPFRVGLRLVIYCFLDAGWRVAPYLSWRGGLAPKRSAYASRSLSYHTRGREPGRWHYKFGHFSDIMHIDPYGYAGYSRYAESRSEDVERDTAHLSDTEIEAGLAPWRERYLGARFTWREQPPAQDLSALRGARTFFLPLQDPLDEVAALGFLRPAEMIEAFRAALGPSDRTFVKRHPVDTTQTSTALLEGLAGDSRFLVVDASVHDLFAACDAVVVVNSGVGFEALLAGLPVIAAGLSDYNLAATTVRSTEALIAALNDIGSAPPLAWRNRVIWRYFHRYALDPQDPAAFRQRLPEIFGFGRPCAAP